MEADGETAGRRLYALLLAAFAMIGLLAGVDLLADTRAGTTWRHVAIEGAVVAMALLGVVVVSRRLRQIARHVQIRARELNERLEASRADARRWQQEARTLIAGLGAAIDQQFDTWALTPAERDIALLLLKGFSHKEIAGHRGASEATVRQQARAVYRKAGLAGRRDLAAFFLEELALPPVQNRQ